MNKSQSQRCFITVVKNVAIKFKIIIIAMCYAAGYGIYGLSIKGYAHPGSINSIKFAIAEQYCTVRGSITSQSCLKLGSKYIVKLTIVITIHGEVNKCKYMV